MTELAIIGYHFTMFFTLFALAMIWTKDSWPDVIIKSMLYMLFFWNAAILATWLGWIKVV